MTYTHGNYGYSRKACRCDVCRSWYNAKMRAYRQRRKERTGTRILHGRFTRDETSRPGEVVTSTRTGLR